MTGLLRLGGIGDEAAVSVEDQVRVHRELGWRWLELRTVDGIAVGDLTLVHVERIAELIASAGLSVPCVDSRIGNWSRPIDTPFAVELAELDAVAARAHLLGTRYVRIMSFPNASASESKWAADVLDRIRVLVRRAEELDIVLLHENCSGWAASSPERALRLLEEADSPHLRLLFDVGNPVAHGYDGAGYLSHTVDWVRHVHLKDALPPSGGGEAVFTMPGGGAACVTDRVAQLLSAGYDGVFCVEPHLTVQPHIHGRSVDRGFMRESYLEYGRRLQALLSGSGFTS
ncbi:sugar phosphate isomerase/epimerase family protein [Nocardia anaemiae]|uniref:sugar phosphate isomerase/epimerase family protein n=1 Tax=Nocardia anaemiae TaxID=263910 RepID=UPI0007A415EC|nr:sugar phosphate isomerase/epimerase family protein [Nocardia anaemiae]